VAVLAPQLENQLHWLKLSHEQGQLTDAEYIREREAAINALNTAWINPAQANQRDAHWLHDELDFLSLMQQQGEITPAEYGPARAIIVGRYQP
jgi:hypothetical protein